MAYRIARRRIVTLLMASVIAVAAIIAPLSEPTPASAHHDKPINHKAADYGVILHVWGTDGGRVKPGARLTLAAHMQNYGSAPTNIWDNGTDRPRLTMSLPPDFTGISVRANGADRCEISRTAEEGKLPGSFVRCEGTQGSVGKEQPGLLFPDEPRYVIVDVTAPHTEGQRRVSARIDPIKYWDSAPEDNDTVAVVKVERFVTKSDAQKGPRYGQ